LSLHSYIVHELDPLPTKLLKAGLDHVLPSITDIVNKSLSEQCVPASFKQAIVRPLLKKPNLSPVHEIRFKPQQSIFGNASGIFQTIEKYLMVNGIKRLNV
jgi:hypothetical protein